MRLLLALLCFFCLSACTKKDPLLSHKAFTAEYVAAFQKASPATKIKDVRDLELTTVNSSGEENFVFLKNCYNEYIQAPENKDKIIAQYVAGSSEANTGLGKIDPARITPVIKDTGWVAEMQAVAQSRTPGKPLENVYEKLNEELVIVYAEDSPKNLRYLTPKIIQEANIKNEDLRDLAKKNLKAILPQAGFQNVDGIFVAELDGCYEPSLLIFDELWSKRTLPVDGDYVVAIPARGCLFVAGSNDKKGIAKLKEFSAKILEKNSYRLTSDLFIYKDGRFTKYKEEQRSVEKQPGTSHLD